ncbi:helix-turn-helix transcriptional regulator [Mixta mediterraneensis]|uniref:helix-turn-helix transcriptional regulator n=1 Tax=Mixta mediterraneensis TaxID=2758443 RepID=UPI001875B793|nr:AlpA family phage regulatory protein [Mixta mediterraneensis]MBE5252216.1 AlpA family phage regulatory protein [Mixta mediterraneensis]
MPERYVVSPAEARHLLDHYGEKYDRLVNEHERRHITGICRTHAWSLEKTGDYPARRKVGVGNKKCGWLLSELLHWIHNQPLS